MSKSTGRSPSLWWSFKDLEANGFAEAFKAHIGTDGIMGVYVPVQHLRAWLNAYDKTITSERATEIMKEHPVELTLRQGNEERTMDGTFNETHTCPPPPGCC